MIVNNAVLVSLIFILLTLTTGNIDTTTSNTIPAISSNEMQFLSNDLPDNEGPEFQCPYFPNWIGTTVMLAPGYTWGRIDSYLISVNVTDPAGVDCVQMVKKASLSNGYYEWINYTMKHDSLPNNPNRYTYNCSFQEHGDIVNFYFIANDTLGNWNITTDYWLESRVIVKVPSTSVDVLDSIFLNPFVFSGMIGGIIVLILLYRHRKYKINLN